MVKNKKILAVIMAATMISAMVGGCTKASKEDNTLPEAPTISEEIPTSSDGALVESSEKSGLTSMDWSLYKEPYKELSANGSLNHVSGEGHKYYDEWLQDRAYWSGLAAQCREKVSDYNEYQAVAEIMASGVSNKLGSIDTSKLGKVKGSVIFSDIIDCYVVDIKDNVVYVAGAGLINGDVQEFVTLFNFVNENDVEVLNGNAIGSVRYGQISYTTDHDLVTDKLTMDSISVVPASKGFKAEFKLVSRH